MTDALLPLVAAGDTTALDELVKRYERVIWWMTRQYAFGDPEDAVQDVFLALWQAAPKYDPAKAAESTFVGMLARRKLIDRYRRATRRPLTQDLESAPPALLREDAPIEETAEAALVARVMRRELRPEQRSVIELSIFEGLSHREIASRTGMPIGTVKTHIRRGLMQLRELLQQPQEIAA
jgi:RNA polymerase sigma-70 factor (ECF subfamily)